VPTQTDGLYNSHDETRGNPGTDGTFTGFCELEPGVRPVCPRLSPNFPRISRISDNLAALRSNAAEIRRCRMPISGALQLQKPARAQC